MSYTYSRTTDNGAGRNDLLPNAFDDTGYYGISDLDRPHVLVSQAHYRFPQLESSSMLVREVLGGWDVAGILQAQSGSPFDVRTTVDIAGVGPGSGVGYGPGSGAGTGGGVYKIGGGVSSPVPIFKPEPEY